jgi:hypothetical protein
MAEVSAAGSTAALVRPVEIIAYLISPIHVIGALGAARALHGDRLIRVRLVVHWPYADAAQVGELRAVIERMARGIPEVVTVLSITTESLNAVMGRNDTAAAAAELRARVGGENFDEIYYSHDVVGEFYWALAEAYPRARRICFGDGLGIVYERKYHMDISYPPVDADGEPLPPTMPQPEAPVELTAVAPVAKPSGLARLWSLLGGSGAAKTTMPAAAPAAAFGTTVARPHIAALVLPVDQSGRFLQGVELRTVPRELVVKLVEQAASGCDDFVAHTEAILARCGDRPKFLLITENNAEGECISFEREIEMYCSIVRDRAPKGAAVVLKSHPGEALPRNEAITAALCSDYELFTIDPAFKRYPIELARRLVHECEPICMSYPTLSLKYLYDIDVAQPMTDAFIEHWFPKRFWPAYKNSFLLYNEPLQRLKGWDGTSLLWRGG